MGDVVVAVVLVGVAGYAAARFWEWLSCQWFLMIVLRVLTGGHPHGRVLTDAGWLRPGSKALTKSGHAPRYWHRPRAHRAGINLGWLAASVAVTWGLLAHRTVTLIALGLVTILSSALAARAVLGRRRRRTWLLPLHLAAHELAGHPRAALASSWISVTLDDAKAVTGARLALSQGWPADEADKRRLVSIASQKLAIESAEPSWRLGGPAPCLVLSPSAVPPPGSVLMADVLDMMRACAAHELLVGIGKGGRPVTVSLNTDSPHLAVSMGTGAGKSNLASWILLQVLLASGIGLVLDAKRGLSYPWLIKDERGEWSYLPCIGYARTTSQLHGAMTWLSGELDRRNDVAVTAIDAGGKVRADVGARLLVLAEELNMAVPRLKAHWASVRPDGSPGRSPAFTGLGETAFAGRQVHMHEVLIGQMLTAEATGSRDSAVRENCGIKMLARYGTKSWRVMCDDTPMPPPPEQAGRVQVVTGRRVREAQVPLFDPLLARRLVLESDMAVPPWDMPCTRRVPGSPVLPAGGAEQPVVPVSKTPAGPLVTLSEAVAEGAVSCSVTALRKRSQRPGFPPHKGLRGLAKEYDALELAEFDEGRRWR